MKKSVLLGVLVSSTMTWAGPSTSGGGFAVVCRDSESRIKSSELLDLYEGRVLYGFELMPASGDMVKDYVRSVKNGYRHQGAPSPLSESEISQNVDNFMRIAEFLSVDEKLPNLADHNSSVALPESCKLEPLAIFYDEQEVIAIDGEIWNSLDSLSRAALVTHESVYRDFRRVKVAPDLNSVEARTFTASDFAINLGSVTDGLPSDAKYVQTNCSDRIPLCAETTFAYKISGKVLNDSQLMMRLQFLQLAGRPLKTLTVIDVPKEIYNGQILPVRSKQLVGWTAEVVQKEFPLDGGHVKVVRVKLVIRRGSVTMFEIAIL